MRILLAVSLVLLTGCSQLNSLEITEDDNAMACVKANSSGTGGVFGASISGITVELPSSVDTSGWTAQDWKDLAEICD